MIYDLVILVILIVFLIRGIRRGAAKTLLSALALVSSAVLSIAFQDFSLSLYLICLSELLLRAK